MSDRAAQTVVARLSVHLDLQAIGAGTRRTQAASTVPTSSRMAADNSSGASSAGVVPDALELHSRDLLNPDLDAALAPRGRSEFMVLFAGLPVAG